MRLRRLLFWFRAFAIAILLTLARRPLLNLQNLPAWLRLRFSSTSHPARVGHSTMSAPDIVRLTASQLQHLLSTGQLTSVELVRASLAQIDRYNRKGLALRAVVSVAPDDDVLERAAVLDAERAAAKFAAHFMASRSSSRLAQFVPGAADW